MNDLEIRMKGLEGRIESFHEWTTKGFLAGRPTASPEEEERARELLSCVIDVLRAQLFGPGNSDGSDIGSRLFHWDFRHGLRFNSLPLFHGYGFAVLGSASAMYCSAIGWDHHHQFACAEAALTSFCTYSRDLRAALQDADTDEKAFMKKDGRAEGRRRRKALKRTAAVAGQPAAAAPAPAVLQLISTAR